MFVRPFPQLSLHVEHLNHLKSLCCRFGRLGLKVRPPPLLRHGDLVFRIMLGVSHVQHSGASRPQALSACAPACVSRRRQTTVASAGPTSTGSSSKPAGSLGAAAPTQHSFARRQQVAQPQTGISGGTCTPGKLNPAALYSAALSLARTAQYERARRVFAKTVSEHPCWVKPWVSWAQMEKRCMRVGDDTHWAACRTVLQRGLLCNRDAPQLLQAWGLMEMQRGNWQAAVALLERSVLFEPRNSPVLRWKPVIEARKTVGERQRCRGSGKSTGGGAGSS